MSNVAERTVGVIGLGAMGRPVAGYLALAGCPTVAYDPDGEAVAEVVEQGVQSARGVRELAARSDIVLLMVPSDQDVLDVSTGADGVLAGAAPGSVLLICSSVTPATCRLVEEQAEPRGVEVLDAALTGGVRAAAAGEINLLVGGEQRVLDAIRPWLAPWTKAVHHLGALGAGQIGKTVNNLCHWGQLAAIVEALRLGRELGVAPERLRAAVLDGPAASRTLGEMQLMRLAWYEKDILNALRMAETVGAPMPVAQTAREAMRQITVPGIADLFD
jgi:3-hydroxyisobutyrate dehydrogenase-like beta-hydroxyacid dehydrogenase